MKKEGDDNVVPPAASPEQEVRRPSYMTSSPRSLNFRSRNRGSGASTVQPFIITNVHGVNSDHERDEQSTRFTLNQAGMLRATFERSPVVLQPFRDETDPYHNEPNCPSGQQHVARVQLIDDAVQAECPEPKSARAVDLFKTNSSYLVRETCSSVQGQSNSSLAEPVALHQSHEPAPTRESSGDLACVDHPLLGSHVPTPKAVTLRVDAEVFFPQGTRPANSLNPKRDDLVNTAIQVSLKAFLSAVAAAGAARAAVDAVSVLVPRTARDVLLAQPIGQPAVCSDLAHSVSSTTADNRRPRRSPPKHAEEAVVHTPESQRVQKVAVHDVAIETCDLQSQSNSTPAPSRLPRKTKEHRKRRHESQSAKPGATRAGRKHQLAQPSLAAIETAIARACMIAGMSSPASTDGE